MHDTAMITGNAFFRCYGDPLTNPRILDVGSMNVNGTLREVAPQPCDYIGLDISDGPGVDIVCPIMSSFKFLEDDFDLIVSTSCFEHDPMFWQTFIHMCEVVRPGGFIYVSAPANGPYHGYPGDCWRFYKDSAKALVTWAKCQTWDIDLLESFQMQPRQDVWIDQVMVFGKPPVPQRRTIKSFLGPINAVFID